MFGIVRTLGLRLILSLAVAVAVPVGLVAANTAFHSATPGRSEFTTPNGPSGTESPEATATATASPTASPTDNPSPAANSLLQPADNPSPSPNHGQVVSEAARSACVGGPNDNHGGYVSSIARGSPVPTASPCPTAMPHGNQDQNQSQHGQGHKPDFAHATPSPTPVATP